MHPDGNSLVGFIRIHTRLGPPLVDPALDGQFIHAHTNAMDYPGNKYVMQTIRSESLLTNTSSVDGADVRPQITSSRDAPGSRCPASFVQYLYCATRECLHL